MPSLPQKLPRRSQERMQATDGGRQLLIAFPNCAPDSSTRGSHSHAVMDLMRAGETVLRSSQPLLPFLAPAAYRQPTARMAIVTRHCRAQHIQSSGSRSFATSMRARKPEDTEAPMRPSSHISNILDEALEGNKGTPTAPSARTSRFASRNAQDTSTPSRAQLAADKRSSFDDLQSSIMSMTSKRNVARSLNPRSTTPAAPKPAPMKLGPNLGRTVYVDESRGFDVAKAFRSVDIIMARNNVRKDFNRQRFHERNGAKRKRLHSERWRKRFKLGFQAVVRRVMKMKKQGW